MVGKPREIDPQVIFMNDQKRNRWQAWFKRGLILAGKALDEFFIPSPGRFSRIFTIILLAGLVLYGVLLWGIFYSWGNISFDFLDWAEVTGPRYALLRDAATHGQLPLHAANLTALRGVTDRYFAIPDTPFSPEYLLLPFFQTGLYLFLDTLLFYLIGSVGLLLIYRKFRLSPFTFWLLFLLFNFNGHVTSQLAVGHSIWIAYFLMPYFVLLIFDLIENQRIRWKWILGLCILLIAIEMQGGYHMFFYCLLFLGLLALFNWHLFKPILVASFFVVLVSLPRLLPPSLALSGITHKYLGGFPSVTDMIAGMVVLDDPMRAIQPLSDTYPLNIWEVDYYIGLLGFALLVIAGIVLPLRQDRSKNAVQVQILVPCLVLAVFSIGQLYANFLFFLWIPPFTGERVISRMFMLPLVFILVLSVIFLQRSIDRNRMAPWMKILALVLGLLVFHDLYQHLRAWRIRYLDAMVWVFPKVAFDPAQHTLLTRSDPIYIAMLAGGAAVALLALAFLVGMALRSRAKA
jgi:hypothetical protein